MTGPEHPEMHDNAGAYLLDALEPGEARAFERHLEGCAACREEVARLRPAMEMLPRSVDPVAPSPALKQQILARVRDESAPDAAAAPSRAPRRGFGGLFARPRLATAWASAAVLVLCGAAGGYAISQLSGGDDGNPRVLSAQVDRKALPDAGASLVVPSGGGPAELRVKGMKVPPRGQVYEIWLRRPSGVEPAGVFTVTRDGQGRATVDGELSGSDEVMVTRERAGGVRQPTGTPVLAVRL
jgi:anti-sigma factor RsiW